MTIHPSKKIKKMIKKMIKKIIKKIIKMIKKMIKKMEHQTMIKKCKLRKKKFMNNI
jgi:glutamyl-tRNA reductase